MRFSSLFASSSLALALLSSSSTSAEAFTPNAHAAAAAAASKHPSFVVKRQGKNGSMLQSTATTITSVPTTPIEGMRPGTSGLRKKVEVWQGVDDANKHYVENFIQSLVDTAKEANGGTMLDT